MILLNDFRRQWEDVREDVLKTTDIIGRSGWYILGPEVEEFEASLARYWSAGRCIGVASGLDAIEISLRVLGCKPGDRVLTSPISAFATVMAILRLGAIPVLIDCDDHGLIDFTKCRQFLESNKGVRFLVPVHLFGHALNNTELRRLRDDFELRIVEDCAQSIGARFNGSPTGQSGHVFATSFYPTKNLGAIGDGGAILTNSLDLADKARILRDYGQTSKYQHTVLGYNSRLDELQAAYLNRVFLPRLDTAIQRRRQIASRYLSEIKNPHLRCPGSPPGSDSSWHLFPVLTEPGRKQTFIQHLRQLSVQCGEHYPMALIEQEALRDAKVESEIGCPQALRFCHSEVSLPIHPYLTDDQVAVVVEACSSWRP